jgi:hypothetical protein
MISRMPHQAFTQAAMMRDAWMVCLMKKPGHGGSHGRAFGMAGD